MVETENQFTIKKTLNCGGRLIDLTGGKIMGVLNVTPDSFFDGGQYITEDAQWRKTEQMLNEGATFIDIGGYSTRPGATDMSVDEEMARVIPAIEKIRRKFPEAILSIDTFRAKVAEEAVTAGAHIINDISGGQMDETMWETAARLQVPYILMHIQGNPQNMQENPHYEDITKEILYFFSKAIENLTKLGLNDVIIDPGFGFGKNLLHNFQLLKKMQLFPEILGGRPLMAGVSRKSMINKLLGTKPENALNGTTVVNTLALLHNADILRVHDVKEAAQTLKIVNYYREAI